jgi:aminoglycoside phosphotransferase (APT) family kinase protein
MLGQVEGFLRARWTEFGLGEPSHPTALRLAVVNGGMGVHNKMVCPCWKGDDELPCLIVKFPRYPRYNYRLQAEYKALERVWGFLRSGPDAERAPRPLVCTEIDGLCVTVETAWRGRSLLSHLRESGEGYDAQLQKLRPLAEWLTRLHTCSAAPATRQQVRELVFEPLESVGEELNLSQHERAVVAHLRDVAERLAASTPLPIVFNHDDLNVMNVLVDELGELACVIDWDAGSFGLPATDLLYFLMRFAYETMPGRSKDPLQSYKELFFETDPAHVPAQHAVPVQLPRQIAVEWLRDYCREVGLAWDWLPILFPLVWIQHARNEKYLLGLHAKGQMLYGISAQVTTGGAQREAQDAMSEQGRFRARLRFYLNNLDDFALTSQEVLEATP